jgi:hypothetical protein
MSTTTKVTSADAGAKIMVVGLIDMGPGQSLR